MKRLTAGMRLAARAAAALAGGYLLAGAWAAGLALLLPRLGINRADAVLAGTLSSFLVYAVFALGVFRARAPAETLRQAMAWLHGWAGLLAGWLLLAIFATGTAAYYQSEISLWMRPELHRLAQAPPQALTATNAMAALHRKAPQAPVWRILLPTRSDPSVTLMWRNPPGTESPGSKRQGGFEREIADPLTGSAPPGLRDTEGGETFYRFHYELHYLDRFWGRLVVGLCAMLMLVALISGVITHRRIFADFFTFRPGKGRRSWLDAHNIAGVLALPYHLMICFSGLVTLMFFYMPWGVQAAYQGNGAAFYGEAALGLPEAARRSGMAAPLTPVGPLLAEASRLWNGAPADLVIVNRPGDRNATIVVTRGLEGRLAYDLQAVTFDGVTGAVLATRGPLVSAPAQTRAVLYGLHLARFADPLQRALLFVSGLAGCAMVATGLLLWAKKRLPKPAQPGLGSRLVNGLNAAAIAGLPLALAAYFWSNRLLPAQLPGRAAAEVDTLFIAWGLAAACSLAFPGRALWLSLLGASALLWTGLPLLDLLTGSISLRVAGFDLVALAIGLMLGGTAWRVWRKPAP